MLEGYERLKNGVIKQIDTNNIIMYDNNYINKYNDYGSIVDNMSYLRTGFLLSKVNNINNILDVGYGNGNFLKTIKKFNIDVFGYDVSGYKLDDINIVNDIFHNSYDVVTFFDSLEHFDDISFIKYIKTKYIFISVPWCHYKSDEWFFEWKHRRYNEHLYHFDDKSLINFMVDNDYELVGDVSNFEDIIRKNNSNENNILSAIFKKK